MHIHNYNLATGSVGVIASLDENVSATDVLKSKKGEVASASDEPDADYKIIQYLQVSAPETGLNKVNKSGSNVPKDVALRAILDNIDNIAEVTSADSATPERVWFTDTSSTAYVDYRIGTTLWRRLVNISMTPGMLPTYDVLGVFAPIGGEWILTKGEDIPNQTPVFLYEYDSINNQWIEKPVAFGAQPL